MFETLKEFSVSTHENKRAKKNIGLKLINARFNNIYYKRISSLFTSTNKQLKELKKGIELISEEFSLQNINSIIKAEVYLTDRFTMLFNQYLIPESISISFKYQFEPSDISESTIANFTISCPEYIFKLLKNSLEESLSSWKNSLLEKKVLYCNIITHKLVNIYHKNM